MTDLSRSTRTRSEDPQNLPRPLDEPDLVVVDTTWGKLQPMEPVPGIRTVGELEIAELITDRMTNPQIAEKLFLSKKTIETHIRNVFHKLGVSSRVEVARVVEHERRERA